MFSTAMTVVAWVTMNHSESLARLVLCFLVLRRRLETRAGRGGAQWRKLLIGDGAQWRKLLMGDGAQWRKLLAVARERESQRASEGGNLLRASSEGGRGDGIAGQEQEENKK